MSQISCNVCSVESCNCYLVTLVAQATQNGRFQKHPSLASILGEQDLGKQKNREASLHSAPVYPSDPGVHRRHDVTPIPLDTFGRYLNQPSLEAAVLEAVPQPASNPSTSGHPFENGYTHRCYDRYCGYGFGHDHDSGRSCDGSDNVGYLWSVVDLRGEVPYFCRVGPCIYWHTDLKQVKRHRDTHFEARYGWLCPNQTVTCPSFRADFRRRDAVRVHCRKFSVCDKTLRAKGGKIECWGFPANDEDLVLYDPKYHVPYWGSDGRNLTYAEPGILSPLV